MKKEEARIILDFLISRNNGYTLMINNYTSLNLVWEALERGYQIRHFLVDYLQGGGYGEGWGEEKGEGRGSGYSEGFGDSWTGGWGSGDPQRNYHLGDGIGEGRSNGSGFYGSGFGDGISSMSITHKLYHII